MSNLKQTRGCFGRFILSKRPTECPCTSKRSTSPTKVGSKVLEKEIRDSNRYLFWFYLAVFGAIGFYIGLALFDERYRYFLYVTKPHIMRRVNQAEDWTAANWAALNATYDIPQEVSFAALRKFYQSVRRVRLQRSLEKEDQHVTALIEDAKEMDKKLLEWEKKLTGKNLAKS
jgi:hypothetical protein